MEKTSTGLNSCEFSYGGGADDAFGERFHVALRLGPRVWAACGGGGAGYVTLIGYSRAAEMMLSGEWVEAEEALKIGLVREIVPPDKLMTRAREYAHKLLQGAPMPQWCIKQLLIRSMNNPTNLQELMNLWSSDLWRSEDFKEGATSFVEKREPKFKGW